MRVPRFARLLWLHSNPKAPSNASPRGTPTPAPTAVALLDEVDGVGHVVRFVDGVAVVDEADVTVTVLVSLMLGIMEPDVLLKITLPTVRGNGVLVPRVVWLHVSDDSSGPQQKETPFSAVHIVTPHEGFTGRQKCKH